MSFLSSNLELSTFLLGFLGGLIPDLLRMVGSRYEKAPDYLFRAYFWISLLLLGLIGGGTALWSLTSQSALSPVNALAVGFSAPAIISKLLSTSPPSPPGGASPGVRGTPPERASIASKLRSWWAV